MYSPPSGTLSFQQITNPAAGANFSTGIGAGRSVRLHYIEFTLTTDGTAANRGITLTLGTALVQHPIAFCNTNQAASNVKQYMFHASTPVTSLTVANLFAQPIPPNLWIPTGLYLGSDIINIQAGDQLSDIYLYVEEKIHA
jgi:hypothetical protein